MKKPEKLSEEKKARLQKLREMMQDPKKDPLAKKLKELESLLNPLQHPMLLEDAAKEIGTSIEGIKTLKASTVNDIDIFFEEKGEKKNWYIKIKKKQP